MMSRIPLSMGVQRASTIVALHADVRGTPKTRIREAADPRIRPFEIPQHRRGVAVIRSGFGDVYQVVLVPVHQCLPCRVDDVAADADGSEVFGALVRAL